MALVGNIWTMCCLAVFFTFVEATPSSLSVEKFVESTWLVERKSSIESKLRELQEANLPKDELAQIQSLLSKFLVMLIGIEESVQNYKIYLDLINELPKKLDQLSKINIDIDTQDKHYNSNTHEDLIDNYEQQREKIQGEIDEVIAKTTRGGLRLVYITEDLEARYHSLATLEKEFLKAQGNQLKKVDHEDILPIADRLLIQIQKERAEIEELETERLWLTKREVLHDEILRIARQRLQHVQHQISIIRERSKAEFLKISQVLQSEIKRLEELLLASDDLAKRKRYAVQRDTVSFRLLTANYREQLDEIKQTLYVHETRNTRMKRETEYLLSLIEKYTQGEEVAQRLQILFKQLKREREHYDKSPVEIFKMQLYNMHTSSQAILRNFQKQESDISEKLFLLENKLYEFDQKVMGQVEELRIILSAVDKSKREKEIQLLKKDLEVQKKVLRDQKEVLTYIVQKLFHLISLYHEYIEMIDENYNLLFNKMFLVRDGEPLNLSMLPSILESIETITQRLDNFFSLTTHADSSGVFFNYTVVVAE